MIVTPTTAIDNGPYDPGYTNINQLVADATFIVTGRLKRVSGIDQNGQPITIYPIAVQKVLGSDPPIEMNVDQTEFNAAKLRTGADYVFFWGADSTGATCIVGGIRGVMAYDSSTDTVSRLDSNANSFIPRTQTFEQLQRSIESSPSYAQRSNTAHPPVCSSFATGLPS
jgi:hypothetical protein